MRAAACLLLLLAACVAPSATFLCASSADCTGGGTCEAAHVCAFADAACDSGRRYGAASGELSEQCVPADAPPPDPPPDGPPEPPPGATCGDGVVTSPEECDDGNTADGDACNANCLACGPGAVVDPQNQHCYVVIAKLATWGAAATDCVAQGGHLASISGAHENAFVAALAGSGRYWIGLQDARSESDFVWEDDQPLTYQSWAFLEPSTLSGDDCASLDAGAQRWDQRSCAGNLPYVCERAPWTVDATTRHAYRQVTGVGRASYAAAAIACGVIWSAHLVSITTAGEQVVVASLTGASHPFIGLNDLASEGTYVWETNEPAAYFAWAPGEPDGLAISNQDCATIEPDGWHDRECSGSSSERGYVCELDP